MDTDTWDSINGLFSNDVDHEYLSIETINLGNSFILEIALPDNDFNQDKKALFATKLWPASIELAKYLYKTNIAKDKSVIELGCGAGLPSIVCALTNASFVCVTDYPVPSVLNTVNDNISRNIKLFPHDNVVVMGHIWGASTFDVLDWLHQRSLLTSKYDIVIASECIWRPDSHEILLQSISSVIQVDGIALITYTNHIPSLESEYLKFFELAKIYNLFIIDRITFNVKHMWNDSIVESYLVILKHQLK